MRIGIDARFYGEAGPGRYVSELLKKLEEIDRENEYVVFLKKSNFGSFVPRSPRFSKRLADFHWYSLAEQLIFPLLLYRENLELVHFTQINTPLFFFGRFIVTVHDLILHEFSTARGRLYSRWLYRLKKVFYELVFLKDVYFSEKIIVPSRATQADLLTHYRRLGREKIVITPEAADHYATKNFQMVNGEVLRDLSLQEPYLLYLGSFYPHKNVQRLVQAFGVLKDQGIFKGQLVLIGKESFFSVKLREFIDRKKIGDVVFPALNRSVNYLDDQKVETILAKALLYIQPSLKEGFALTPLEAMALGVPVIAADIPCLREVCAEAALYFDPLNVSDLVSKIEKMIDEEGLRGELIKKGLENVKRFSWKKMAEETLAVYRTALEK